MKSQYLLLLTLISPSLQAQITTDGSLGPLVNLPGPDYQITADLGQQYGGNLFHSFQDFNLQSFETATFSGLDTVQNVISRVTGGNPSNIDGTIRTTLPNADFYFLNPYGLLLGPNARLDVSGSFHASTADYLGFSDGKQFHARELSESLLTVAPIEAFGFLTPNPAPITVEESQLMLFNEQTFSLIGGDITINGHWFSPVVNKPDKITSVVDVKKNIEKLDIFNPLIFSETGHINLISYANPGEMRVSDLSDFPSSNEVGGQIRMTHTNIGVSGPGEIFIRAGELILMNSVLTHVNFDEEESGLIDIAVNNLELMGDQQVAGIYTQTEGIATGPAIDIVANNLNIQGTAAITTATHGAGASGPIHLNITEHLNIAGQYIPTMQISNGIITVSSTQASGNTSDIDIEAGQLTINQGLILTLTAHTGNAGHIFLKVAEDINVIGGFITEYQAPSGVLSSTFSEGNAGNIEIQARQINLSQGGQILNRSFGSGDSGLIDVTVSESIVASGQDEMGNSSGFTGRTGDKNVNNTGDAANIRLIAPQITLLAGASIESETHGAGDGGMISIQVADKLVLIGQDSTTGTASNISASSLNLTANAGDAGHIEIATNQLELKEGGAIYSATLGVGESGAITIKANGTLLISGGLKIPWLTHDIEKAAILPSGIFTTSGSNTTTAGHGGQIEIQAKQIILQQGGQINNDTFGDGDGGLIKIVTEHLQAGGQHTYGPLVYLSGVSSGSLSDSEYAGKAGDLLITADKIILTQAAEFSTAAANAEGGNITINIPNSFILQDNAKIITSVQGGTGNGGNITISNPRVLVLDKSQIKAQADQGQGGNIRIVAEHFIKSTESLISASSRLGIDGQVEIDSPDDNVIEEIHTLSTNTIDARRLIQKTCETMTYEDYQNRARFLVYPIVGHPISPYDLQPSRLSQPLLEIALIPEKSTQQLASHSELTSFIICQRTTEQMETVSQVIPTQLF